LHQFLNPYIKKAAAKRFTQQRATQIDKPLGNLKRRVGYFEEELSTTRVRLSDMQVEEGDRQDQVLEDMSTGD